MMVGKLSQNHLFGVILSQHDWADLSIFHETKILSHLLYIHLVTML